MRYKKSEVAETVRLLNEKILEAATIYRYDSLSFGYAIGKAKVAELDAYVFHKCEAWDTLADGLTKLPGMTPEEVDTIVNLAKKTHDEILNVADAIRWQLVTSILAVQAAVGNGTTIMGQA